MKRQFFMQLGKPAIITLIIVGVLLIAGFTGCTLSSLIKTDSNLNPGETPPLEEPGDDTNDNDVENEVIPPVVVYYNVLTGLETTSELADLRPVSVCIANSAYSLPQDGISDAEVVIEMPTENGTTRLMLLTTNYQKVATIGSVYSTRHYMMQVAQTFQAIQCFNGSNGTVSPEQLLKFDTLDYDSQKLLSVYYKDDTKVAPYDLMTNGVLIHNAITKYQMETKITDTYKNPFVFAAPSDVIRPDGGAATSLSIIYADDLTVNYHFNKTTNKYVRYQFGEPQIDGNNGKAVSFDNIFVLFASSVTYDKEDGTQLDLVMKDGGSGYYCTGGTYEKITWSYNEDGTMAFYDENGNALEVNRGSSYIGFVQAGIKDKVTIQ